MRQVARIAAGVASSAASNAESPFQRAAMCTIADKAQR